MSTEFGDDDEETGTAPDAAPKPRGRPTSPPVDGSDAGRSFATAGAALVLALGTAGAMVALWQMFGGEGGEELPQFGLFLAQFHPLVVHVPLALLVAVFLMEFFSMVPAWRELRRNTLFLLWLASIGATGAIIAGYLLKASGEYGGPRVESHMWLGIAVAVGAWAALILKSAGSAGLVYRILLAATVTVLVLAGHLGGTITHGADYLVKYMPEPYRSYPVFAEGRLLSILTGFSGGKGGGANGLFYGDYVAPILEQKCTRCHGEDKQKGKLRLDTHAFILAGAEGSDYSNVVPGKPGESEMLARAHLAVDDDDHMPPEDEPQLTESELKVLEWWIEKGASKDLASSVAKKDGAISAILAKLAKERTKEPAKEPAKERGKERAGAKADEGTGTALSPALAGKAREEEREQALKVIEAQGYALRAISAEDDGLQFNALNGAGEFDDAAIALFEPVARSIVELRLGKTKITDEGLEVVGKMGSLMTLHLESTSVTDAGIGKLTGLSELARLNLYGTKVTDGVIDHLLKLKRLERVYLWQTGVSEKGAEKLRAARKGIFVDMGWKEEEAPAAKPGPGAEEEEKAKQALSARKKAAGYAFVHVQLRGNTDTDDDDDG